MIGNIKNTLSICTYNCQSLGTNREIFIKSLIDNFDFILIQEHCKYLEQLSDLTKLGPIQYHGNSGMNITQPLVGRPHGGCVILWKQNCKCTVTPVNIISSRICAVVVQLNEFNNNIKILLINVYFPCDDRTRGSNFNMLEETVADIENIILDSVVDHIIIAGDLNCDLTRHTVHVNKVKEFVESANLHFVDSHATAKIPYSFESKGSGVRSTIDHIILDHAFYGLVKNYYSFDSVDNTSDHCAICCELDLSIAYIKNCDKQPQIRPAWYKAGKEDIHYFQTKLDQLLTNIQIPSVIECSNLLCMSHNEEIEKFHNDIIQACMEAANTAIPKTGFTNDRKTIPGWNIFVKQKKKIANFWYKIWVENGRPNQGDITTMMKEAKKEYHYAIRFCKRNENEIRNTRLAESLQSNKSRNFWSEINKCRHVKSNLSSIVDGISEPEGILDRFYEIFESLYTSVSYNEEKLKLLEHRIKKSISSDFNNICKELITEKELKDAVNSLKGNKADATGSMNSDCLKHGTEKLHKMLLLLYNSILVHGYMPSETLRGTMTPIPKDRFKIHISDKYRAITLSSCISKLLDLIIFNKCHSSLLTDDLQFGFKEGCSTDLCSGFLKETVNHFINNGSHVYGLFLDATKAFDRVNYCKLFEKLIDRRMNSIYLRCLLYMYTNQSLCVKWNGLTSSNFTAKNGVKQGGIISPILFCIYIDDLLVTLKESGYGCHIGPYYCGALGYADDICLLSPSLSGLNRMIKICEQYADDHCIMFNGSKSQLIKFEVKRQVKSQNDHVHVYVSGIMVKCQNEITHLGHKIYNDINKDDIKCVISKFWKQYNMFKSQFVNLSSEIKNKLFHTYCTSFYGVQICDISKTDKLQAAYRKCVRNIWNISYRTHNDILLCLTGQICSKHMLLKRFIKFAFNVLNHKSHIIKYIYRNGLTHSKSHFSSNVKIVTAEFNIEVNDLFSEYSTLLIGKVINTCKNKCQTVENKIKADVIKELVDVRDRRAVCPLDIKEAMLAISTLCVM